MAGFLSGDDTVTNYLTEIFQTFNTDARRVRIEDSTPEIVKAAFDATGNILGNFTALTGQALGLSSDAFKLAENNINASKDLVVDTLEDSLAFATETSLANERIAKDAVSAIENVNLQSQSTIASLTPQGQENIARFALVAIGVIAAFQLPKLLKK